MAYAFKRTLTCDHGQAGASDSTDFAVSVVFTDTTMKLVGSGGHINNTVTSHGQTVPADLAFFSDSGLTTALAFEIESYDATAGTIVAWVKIPTLSHTADTLFYMGYDDAAVTTFQGNVSGTWPTGVGIWHVANGSSLSLLDSSANGFTLTNNAGGVVSVTAGAGQIDGGAIYVHDGIPEYLSAAANAAFDLTAFTISAWVQTSTTGNPQAILSRDNGTQRLWQFRIEDTTGLRFFAGYNGSFDITAGGNLEDGAWHVVHGVVSNGGKTGTIYIDGAAVGANTSGTAIDTTAGANVGIGALQGTLSPTIGLSGSLDEPRYVGASLSADWITAEFNNQKASQTFLSVGAETPTGGGTSFTLTADAGSYSITGTAVTLKAARTMTVAAGSYAVTGSAVTFIFTGGPVHYVLTADSGSYVMTGFRVRLIWSGAPTTGNFPQCMNIAIMGL